MRKQKKQYLHLPLLLILTCLGLAGKPQSPRLDLKHAIAVALANNYSLKADSMNVAAASYQINVAKAAFLPQVKFSGKTEYSPIIASQMLPGTMIGQSAKDFVPVKFGTHYSMVTSVEATQNVINKALRFQATAASINSRIARTRQNLTREELVYQIATSFYALQTNAEMIRTTGKDYQNIREIVKIVKAQFENGTVKRIDYESLEMNAANKQSQLSQLQSHQKEQMEWFKYLLGIPTDYEITIDSIAHGLPLTATSLIGEATTRNDIFLKKQLIEAKEIELKSIHAERLPVLTSFGRFNYQAQFNKAGDAFKNDYRFSSSTIGVAVSLPIFDGNRRKNRLQTTQAELKQLHFQTEQQQRLAQTEYASSNEALNDNRQQYLTTQQNLVLAEKVFAARKALYTEGVTSLIELLDAEKELSQARNLHIQAMINVHTGMVDVYKAKGTLLTHFLNSL